MKLVIAIGLFVLSACGGGGGSQAGQNPPLQTSESIQTAPEASTGASPDTTTDTTTEAQETITQTIDGELVSRSYHLRYPANPTESSYPVLFFFHGAGGNRTDWLEQNPSIAELIDAGEFIGVFPQGYQQRWNVSNETNADDVEFISLIINSLDPSGLFDLNRVYGVGVSNGAGLVNRIAKETTIFNAIAPLISQQTLALGDVVPPRAVSVFQVSGADDNQVPLNGGSGAADTVFLSAQSSAENWASNANCNATPTSTSELWGDYSVDKASFNGCLDNTRIHAIIVRGSGHSLSFGDSFNLYSEIWSFFQATETSGPQNFKLLTLGDSYTIGQGVCDNCSFPMQLKESLQLQLSEQDSLDVQIIAETGWTTTSLKNALTTQMPANDFDLVTLLIGVNNQYQNRPFGLYETEFVELVNSAITFAGGDPSKLIVISIPDYAYTRFGQGSNPEKISADIELYNTFAEQYSDENGLSFVSITDITQQGLENPELIAEDGLHPSELAYSQFVERLLPLAIEKLK